MPGQTRGEPHDGFLGIDAERRGYRATVAHIESRGAVDLVPRTADPLRRRGGHAAGAERVKGHHLNVARGERHPLERIDVFHVQELSRAAGHHGVDTPRAAFEKEPRED